MELTLPTTVIMVMCACVISALPIRTRHDELSHLVNLLGKLKNIERLRQNSNTSPWEEKPESEFSLQGIGQVKPDEDSAKNGYLGELKGSSVMNKRQGAWSYDYGLGGGRFGKRSYGDYGIGGGRFGRDVDHVDLSDTSDADITS